MIVYVDTSALVKRYLFETGSIEVNQWIDQAGLVATSLITRAEMGAGITKALRLNWISSEQGQSILQLFRSEWEMLGRIPIHEATVRRADELACTHGLRGYDAVHLACALIYREGLGEPVTLVTYDRLLWQAGKLEGLFLLPAE